MSNKSSLLEPSSCSRVGMQPSGGLLSPANSLPQAEVLSTVLRSHPALRALSLLGRREKKVVSKANSSRRLTRRGECNKTRGGCARNAPLIKACRLARRDVRQLREICACDLTESVAEGSCEEEQKTSNLDLREPVLGRESDLLLSEP